jgi:hypothetical protein
MIAFGLRFFGVFISFLGIGGVSLLSAEAGSHFFRVWKKRGSMLAFKAMTLQLQSESSAVRRGSEL